MHYSVLSRNIATGIHESTCTYILDYGMYLVKVEYFKDEVLVRAWHITISYSPEVEASFSKHNSLVSLTNRSVRSVRLEARL